MFQIKNQMQDLESSIQNISVIIFWMTNKSIEIPQYENIKSYKIKHKLSFVDYFNKVDRILFQFFEKDAFQTPAMNWTS